MGHFMSLIVAILVVLNVLTAHICAEERVALVIGNGTYQKVAALPNPPNDASDVAASLERLGFSVKKLLNAKFDDMRRGLLDFGRQARRTSSSKRTIFSGRVPVVQSQALLTVEGAMR